MAPKNVAYGALEFDQCSISLSRRELRIDGELREIPPKVFDLIVFLISNRSRVVSASEVIANVWFGTETSKAALHRAVMLARQALGDDAKHPRFIKTVNKMGFRFIGILAHEPKSVPSTWPLDLIAVARLRPISLGILHFADQTSGKATLRAADGIFWLLCGRLSTFTPGFRIIRTPDSAEWWPGRSTAIVEESEIAVFGDEPAPGWIIGGRVDGAPGFYSVSFSLAQESGVVRSGRVLAEDLLIAGIRLGDAVISALDGFATDVVQSRHE